MHAPLPARQLVVVWICGFVLSASVLFRAPVLWDLDSYYHLAVAKLYVESGVAEPVPWLRLSLLNRGADKEWLFHILLMPFAALPDAAAGGRLALAMLNASIATVLAAIAGRAVGSAAMLMPLWLWIAAPPLLARLTRLRPELLALLIILCAIPAASRGRYRLLGFLAFAFAAGYTAFHVFVALVFLWTAWRWYRSRRIEWRMPAAVVIGTAGGLLLRPRPVENIRLWYVQNVQFFQNVGSLDVGPEILPPVWPETLISVSVWILTLVTLAVLALRRERAERDVDLLAFTAIAAAVFFILYLRMGRMSTYVYPLASLTVLLAIGQRIRARVAVLVFAAAAGIALFVTFDRGLRDALLHHATAVSELDWWSLGRAMPDGARVAATWADTEAYVFWAPQGRYLNALDPLFMALPYPREYEAQRRLFDGRDPDVPRTLRHVLDSEFIALDWTLASPLLVERLRGDPRIEVVYGGYNALFRVRERPGFITTWEPLRAPADPVAGFVDVTSLAGSGCATVRHRFTMEEGGTLRFAFAPWGASTMTIDGIERVRVGAERALLSRARAVAAPLEQGNHVIEVNACAHEGIAGFYLRRVD